jgi:hypothetical protein
MSKCLVNRLRPIPRDLISPMQSVFILRGLITDNALIAFECFHAMEQGNRSCKEFAALKLDLTKAYDRVDGVKWIMACLWLMASQDYYRNRSDLGESRNCTYAGMHRGSHISFLLMTP